MSCFFCILLQDHWPIHHMTIIQNYFNFKFYKLPRRNNLTSDIFLYFLGLKTPFKWKFLNIWSPFSIEFSSSHFKTKFFNKSSDCMEMPGISTKASVKITNCKHLYGLVYFNHIFNHFQCFIQFIIIKLTLPG